jgi:hypothetical protein
MATTSGSSTSDDAVAGGALAEESEEAGACTKRCVVGHAAPYIGTRARDLRLDPAAVGGWLLAGAGRTGSFPANSSCA